MNRIFLGERLLGPHAGVGDVGLGDVGDLLAYRQEWEPFILAHLSLWQYLNALFEGTPSAKECPPGVFSATQIQTLNPTMRSFCASLALTRMYSSPTDPNGILAQWNAWKDKSSAEIVAGADVMLKWHQDVVMRVGGPYKESLVKIAESWKVDIRLPDVPSFSVQQEIKARIEGAYITTKGVIQIIGYGAGEIIRMAADTTEAVAEGLKETAHEIPRTTRWIGIAAAVTAVVVGGALIVYYKPRKAQAAA